MRPFWDALEKSGGWLFGEIWLKAAGLQHKKRACGAVADKPNYRSTTFVSRFPVQGSKLHIKIQKRYGLCVVINRDSCPFGRQRRTIQPP